MARSWTVPARVVRIIDGDTVELDLDLGWHLTLRRSCRMAGINTPERNQPGWAEATEHLRSSLPIGTDVTFVSTALDKYGRPLGVIEVGKRNVNIEMITSGHAVPM